LSATEQADGLSYDTKGIHVLNENGAAQGGSAPAVVVFVLSENNFLRHVREFMASNFEAGYSAPNKHAINF